MSAQPTASDVRDWADELDAVGQWLGRYFARSAPRRRAVEYLRGLVSDAERKNGWQLAEKARDETPYGVQHLLGRVDWDADKVRDDLLENAHAHLADPQGVLIVDETGFLKKGTKSAGVQRQYSGTAGRIENCQVSVFQAFTTKPQLAELAQVQVDRITAELPPKAWRKASAGPVSKGGGGRASVHFYNDLVNLAALRPLR